MASHTQPLPTAVVRGSLRDGLTVCLGLLTRDPDLFEPAAVVWHRRWCEGRAGLGFAESRATLSALEGLAGPDPEEAAVALRSACAGADGIDEVLDAWLRRRSLEAPAASAADPGAACREARQRAGSR